MKKIYYLILLLVAFHHTSVNAQTFGNEWINYNQSYYKCSVFKDSIYRINISSLIALGMPGTVTGTQLQVFKDGKEIPIYVSQSGSLNATDYIEFFGERATGLKDLPLYQNPSLQLNPDQNLISDTSYYFITFNTGTNHLRYTERINTISSPPAKENYYWNKVRLNFRSEFFSGESAPEGNSPSSAYYELNSSQYEGEGFIRKTTTVADSITLTFPNAFKLSGAPDGNFQSAVIGKSYGAHNIKLYANGTQIADSAFSNFETQRFTLSIPMSLVSASNTIRFKYQPITTAIDRFGIAYAEFRYPSTFSFSNRTNAYFELNPKASPYYLEITNLNYNGVAPKLYDLSNQEYLIGDISQTGIVKFLIPASNSIKRFMIQGQQANIVSPVNNLSAVTFKNYSLTANQGDYLIVTHSGYTNDGTGHDYVNDYKNYRASLSGGGFIPNIAMIEDIYNEFGYGYDYSALALKNYLNYAYASNAWPQKPKFVFIIGKGFDYNKYLNYTTAGFSTFPFYPIPSFGEPSSDLMLTDFDKNNKPLIPIGRLTCFSGSDIGVYLEKVKDHESVIANTNQTTEEKLWQKRFLHIAGTNDLQDQLPIVNSLNGHATRISNPYYGGEVTLLKKSSTQEVETINSKTIDDMINNGVAFIQFFGHSSSSSIDYGLDFPENYTNYKKYYFFMGNGCSAGDVFILTPVKLLSERFVLAPNKAAIGFIANVNTSFSNDLGVYTDSLYHHISTLSYGLSMGEQIQRNVFNLMGQPSFSNSLLFRMHAQQIQMNGDPAVKIYHFPKPDYVIEQNDIRFKQVNLTTTLDSLDIDFTVHNIGKHTGDSLTLVVKRRLPNNTEQFIVNKKIIGFSNTDSFSIRIPTLGENGVGLNNLEIEIDAEFVVDEIAETNNKVNFPFTIYNDDVVPIFPYNFSIVSTPTVELKGSTLKPFADLRKYIVQLDTTENFNSPLIRTTTITSKGGVIRWTPPITLTDSTVYYWRMAMDTLYGNPVHRWTTFSFIHLFQSSPGWNQSHLYQWQKDTYSDMFIDSVQRNFKFVDGLRKLQVQNACMGGALGYDFGDYFVKMNGVTIYNHGCDPSSYGSFQFVVIDSATGQLWQNKRPIPSIAKGRFGSIAPCRGDGPDSLKVNPFFEFSFRNSASRKLIMDFLDSIPSGTYVMFQDRLCLGGGCGNRNSTFINQWKADTSLYGSNNSLYHKLYNLGFTGIDSFTKNRPMVYWTQKDRPSTVQQFIGIDSTVKLNPEFSFMVSSFQGTLSSTKIGPAKNWSQFIKKAYSGDATQADSVVYYINGIDMNGAETWITNVVGDTSLSFINATQFPYLRLGQINTDNTYQTPEQLKYWRVLYTPEPEAALNAALLSGFKDTVNQGEKNTFVLALENLTPYPMDSMLVKFSMVDRNSNTIDLGYQRYRPLVGFDTINIINPIASSAYPGYNTLIVEANPDNDQPEQFHPNNIAFRSFYTVPDNKNPVIDVTFDGVHILDKDIVSAKPFIQIMLKDDNKYLALDDTSLVDVYMKYPNDFSNEYRIPFDGQVLKFIPASTSTLDKKNQARIEFRPTFTVDGDDYVLIVKARDKTGNESGNNAYKVGFEVVNQASISTVLNYPNPFTTSTQFVFTLTGSEIPSNLKIQVLSVTGKVVREIIQSELGPLHIGRNVTEFKWTGDDQFGKPLGNGVYLYRVISNLHGNQMEHRETDADKWMEHGFGKLYIMR